MVLLGWENPLGWLAFLSLVPFILLYFVRPKPVELEVPSLMFFMRSHHVDKERSFFKRFRFDILFLLQLLILSLLALYFIDPFTSFGGNILVDHAVFVVDVSASMQVDERFQDALAFVKKHLARSNTFILVSNVPRVIAEDISHRDAQRLLGQLKATAGRSNIGDALMLATQYIKGEDSSVYVISDFIPTEGVSLEAAKNALLSKQIVPEFHSVKGTQEHSNVGIVDVRLDDASTTIYFKNYNKAPATVRFTVNDDEKTLTIKPQFIEPYSFKTQTGVSEIRLLEQDDFSVDNVAYISVPELTRISALLVTDKASKYLKAALASSDKVDVTVTSTTKIPKQPFDVYILHEVNGNINKEVLTTLTQAVQDGKGLVIHATANSKTINYGDLLPLKLAAYEDDAVIEVSQLTQLTEDILFGTVSHYFSTREEQGATLATAQNSSLLTVNALGNGKVVYYGLLEGQTDFPLQPSYPIFWTKVIRYLADQGDLYTYNVDSGSTLSFTSKKEITTPTKKITATTVLFDEIGLYKTEDKLISSLLADEQESNIDALTQDAATLSAPLSDIPEDKKYDLEKLALITAGILLILELLFMKFRGEI